MGYAHESGRPFPMHTLPLFRQIFHREPDILARAPGRVEVIGNHTDYNGGLVLGAAIDRHVTVALGRRTDRQVHLYSNLPRRLFTGTLDTLAPVTGPDAWVNYPLGVTSVLGGPSLPAGFELCITSTLPHGAGLSSSAALELATALALDRAFRLNLGRLALVTLCREAERSFAGMPCGILDQGVVAFGKQDHLVLVDARTGTFTPIPIPPEASLWVFDTHHRHALTDSLYATRVCECRSALTHLQGVHHNLTCLTELSLTALQPPATELPPILHRRALHVVTEQERVRQCLSVLEEGDLHGLGLLLNASHASSRDRFENSTPEQDFLAEHLVRSPHVYGARLTGGGFGGAVMALTDPAFSKAHAGTVARAYRARFGATPRCLHTRPADGATVVYAGNA